MLGAKRNLFLEVVHAACDRIEATFENAEPTLVALGDAYGRRHGLERLDPRSHGPARRGTLGAGPPGVRCAVVTSGRRKTEFPSAPPEVGLVESLASVAWTWIGESGERGATRSSPCC